MARVDWRAPFIVPRQPSKEAKSYPAALQSLTAMLCCSERRHLFRLDKVRWPQLSPAHSFSFATAASRVLKEPFKASGKKFPRTSSTDQVGTSFSTGGSPSSQARAPARMANSTVACRTSQNRNRPHATHRPAWGDRPREHSGGPNNVCQSKAVIRS